MLKNCEKCGKKLENIGHNAHFCSKECRIELYKVKYRERRRVWMRERYQKRLGELEDTGRGRVVCLICKRKFVQVGTHIYHRHGITAREYREEFGLDVRRGILPSYYREKKAQDARENGMPAMLLEVGKRTRFKKGQKGVGVYRRSKQTRERLSKQFRAFHIQKGAKKSKNV